MDVLKKSAADRLAAVGYEDVVILQDYSYDDALIGVTADGRAVYDYEKMLDWLQDETHMDVDAAVDWLEYNTIRALPYAGPSGPIIMYPLD